MAGSPGTAYKLCFAQRDLDLLKALGAKAERLGIKDQYVEALKTIHQKLTTEPSTWGDPQYALRHMGLRLHHRIHLFFHVSYAVDEQRRIVYVKECTPLQGHSLAEEDEDNGRARD